MIVGSGWSVAGVLAVGAAGSNARTCVGRREISNGQAAFTVVVVWRCEKYGDGNGVKVWFGLGWLAELMLRAWTCDWDRDTSW